jgi:cytolysin (calcineurin-like family phosphatase)
MKQQSSHHAAETGGSRWSRREFLKTGAAAAAGAALPVPAAGAAADPRRGSFGFLVVSDTHFKASEEAPDSLVPEIDRVNQRLIARLNQLPGQPLPPAMGGGRVGEIKGVLHLGDMIDSGDKGTGDLSVRRQATEWAGYVKSFGLTGHDGALRHPVYEVHGNHDSVRETNVVIRSMLERNRKRPGVTHLSDSGLHYSWDWEDVHFIALGIVVGHNDKDLPIGRYKAHDSLQFLRKDLHEKVGSSGRPVILLHHIDLLRYSTPASENAERGGEWSACDVAAFHEAVRDYQIAAIFHGHLHALRSDRWDGTNRSAAAGGIPVFGSRASGAQGVNRGLFYCVVEGGELVIRELASLGAADGWLEENTGWVNQWRVPLRRNP